MSNTKAPISQALTMALIGRTVIWADRASTFPELLNYAQEQGQWEKIVRANGMERVDYTGGGRVFFVSPERGSGRGLSADAVFASPSVLKDHLDDLLPALSGSRYGSVYSIMEKVNPEEKSA